MKKLLSLFLCVIMLLAMATPTLASEITEEASTVDTASDNSSIEAVPCGNDTDISAEYNQPDNCSAVPTADTVSDNTCGENLIWTLSGGTLTISGSGAMTDYTLSSSVSTAPWCSSQSEITTLVIQDGVTGIGNYAFYKCTNITDITLPRTLVSIGEQSFRGCTGITEITIPTSLTSVGWMAFQECTSITSINISDITAWCNIEFSGPSANPVYYAKSLTLNGTALTDLVIPNSVTSIGQYTFYNCTSLTTVTLHSGITAVGSDAFYGCSSLTAVNISDLSAWCNIEFKSRTSNPVNYAKSLTLNGTVLTELVIPDSVTTIGKYAFYYCKSLTSVKLHEKITSIGDYAFYYCQGIKTATIPSGVETIGAYAFSSCTQLTSVNLPETISSLGKYAFSDCSSLTSINIPGNVTRLSEGVFSYCSSLGSIVLHNNVTTIYSSAFSNCSVLTSVTIPASVTSIGNKAFSNCTWLTSVRFLGNAPKNGISTNAFNNVTATIYIPAACDGWSKLLNNNYTGTLTWTLYGNNITASGTLSSSVTWELDASGLLIFNGSGAIPDYTVSSGVTNAPWRTYAASITGVCINSGITGIGSYAFTGTAVSEIEFYGSCPTFTANTFNGITATAEYPISNDTWYPSKLSSYSNITWKPVGGKDDEFIDYDLSIYSGYWWTLDYDGTLITYDYYVSKDYSTTKNPPWYAYRNHIKKVIIKDTSISRIGSYAFYYCTELTDVVIESSATTIGSYAFCGCTSLKNIDLGDKIYNFESYAFGNCTSLESVFIPSVHNSTIADYAFSWCTSLQEITIPHYITLGSNVFEKCSQLKTIYIGNAASSYYFNPTTTSFTDVTATVLYPRGVSVNTGNYGGSLTWQQADYGYCGTNAKWSYDPDTKALAISGSGKISGYNSGSYVPWGMINENILTIHIGNGITSIPAYTFEYCEAVAEIVLPDTLTSLNLYAFQDCGSLNNLMLPASLKTVYNGFIRCESLSDLYYFGTESEWGNVENSTSVSNSNNSSMKLHLLTEVPSTATCTEAGLQAYLAFDDTSIYGNMYDFDKNIITELATVDASGHNYAGFECTRCGDTLDNVSGTCGESITWVLTSSGDLTISGTGTMYDYSDEYKLWHDYAPYVKTVSLASGITSIGSSAFSDCTALENISIPTSITLLGDNAFKGSSNLTCIEFIGDAPDIGSNAFEGITADIYYSAGNDTWTSEKLVSYGGTVTWHAVGTAKIGTVVYDTLSAALAEAKSGDTVTLLCDASENMITVFDGVTLDLNGKVLTATYVFAVKGANVIDSQYTGTLKVNPNNIILSVNNSMIPVYNAVDGYMFIRTAFADNSGSFGVVVDDEADTLKFTFIPGLGGNPQAEQDVVVPLLGDGASDNEMSVVVRLDWETDTGTAYQDFVYTDALVANAVNHRGSYALTLTLSNYSKLKNLNIKAMIISNTGAQKSGTNFEYNK